MKKIILYILFFSVQMMWAKGKGFPSSELDIYKIIKNPITQVESFLYVGRTRTELTTVLGQANHISKNDRNDSDELFYNDGLGISYLIDYPEESYDYLWMISSNTANPYIISQRFQLGIGKTISTELLNNYEYTKTKLNDGITDQYYWDLITPQGEVSDYFLTIDVQKGKIIKIYKGTTL